jgi:phosphatidylethanolamine/phosphatidyl-N-methylethanolamine N-methyltransferase
MSKKLSNDVKASEKNNGLDQTFAYVKSFIKDKNVASVTPTAANVVRAICDRMDFDRDVFLVEYGAGTGVFTFEILKRMSPGSRLLAFETNVELASALSKKNDSRLIVSDQSATELLAILKQHKLPAPDYVLSGIPFTFLDARLRKRLVINTKNVLQPGGRFLVYQASWMMKDVVERVYGNCKTESFLLNLPPIFLMEAQKESPQ